MQNVSNAYSHFVWITIISLARVIYQWNINFSIFCFWIIKAMQDENATSIFNICCCFPSLKQCQPLMIRKLEILKTICNLYHTDYIFQHNNSTASIQIHFLSEIPHNKIFKDAYKIYLDQWPYLYDTILCSSTNILHNI